MAEMEFEPKPLIFSVYILNHHIVLYQTEAFVTLVL